VTVLDVVYLVLAGFGGGLSGSVAGLASLVSYPALLALGLPPVTANVTNTVSLVFSTAGSVAGSRPELAGQKPRIVRLGVVAVAGGITGGLLLLATPSSSFARIVPVLIGVASLGVLLRREIAPTPHAEVHKPGRGLLIAIYVIGVYGGYFGAAAGVLMLSVFLLTSADTLARSNAMKNVLLGMANATAAVAFAIFGHVHWSFVPPLAIGFLVGGRLGPVIVRRVPTGPLRIVIALAGLGLAVHLGLDAYR
jgi:uncharacterized protein